MDGLSIIKVSNHLCKKLRQCCGALVRYRNFLTTDLLYQVFAGLGLTYIHYFALGCSGCNKSALKTISLEYNHCGSVLKNCYMNRLEFHEWSPFNHLLHKIQLRLIHKTFHHNYAPNLKTIFMANDHRPNYNLRDTNRLKVTRFNKCIGQKSFMYWGVKLWRAYD